jgi:hypothetical protein
LEDKGRYESEGATAGPNVWRRYKILTLLAMESRLPPVILLTAILAHMAIVAVVVLQFSAA